MRATLFPTIESRSSDDFPTVTVSGPIKVCNITAGSLAYIREGATHDDVADHDWSTHDHRGRIVILTSLSVKYAIHCVFFSNYFNSIALEITDSLPRKPLRFADFSNILHSQVHGVKVQLFFTSSFK